MGEGGEHLVLHRLEVVGQDVADAVVYHLLRVLVTLFQHLDELVQPSQRHSCTNRMGSNLRVRNNQKSKIGCHALCPLYAALRALYHRKFFLIGIRGTSFVSKNGFFYGIKNFYYEMAFLHSSRWGRPLPIMLRGLIVGC